MSSLLCKIVTNQIKNFILPFLFLFLFCKRIRQNLEFDLEDLEDLDGLSWGGLEGEEDDEDSLDYFI